MKLNKAAQALGRKGGKNRAKNLTKRALSAIGRKGAAARWKSLDKNA
jgi:general stress protein YciG